MTDASRRWLQAGMLVAGVWIFAVCRKHEAPVREVDDSPAAYIGSVDGETHVSFAAPAALGNFHGEQVLCARTRSGHARCEVAYDREGHATAPRRLLHEDEIAARLSNIDLATNQGASTLIFSDEADAFARHYHAPSQCYDAPHGHDCVVRFDAAGKLTY
jgi:hypothetical protein